MTNSAERKYGLWEIVIGLEVHAQVSSASKLFSGSATDGDCGPNTRVNFFDAGMPGTLPVINSFCIDQAIRTGIGVHGKINKVSIFDRKNYFYPDLPNGYQISQFYYPIVSGGYLDVFDNNEMHRIRITRIHLEQDAGKSIHDLNPTKSYIDLNRAGVALMEIVTEPDIRSVEQAIIFAKRLHMLVQYLGTCDGNMEKGNFRIDANISVHKPRTPFGTRVEIKNLNSFKFMQAALNFEIERQIELIENGGTVTQETRLFDPQNCVTMTMRDKENANDYRYFADPDLPPLVLTDNRINEINHGMPELPDQKKKRFMKEFGLGEYDADILSNDRLVGQFYDEAVSCNIFVDKKAAYKLIANWIIGDLFAKMKECSIEMKDVSIKPTAIASIVAMIQDGTISGKIAKTVFERIWNEPNENPSDIVIKANLKQISDENEILPVIRSIINENTKLVDDFKHGKTSVFGFFVGKIMAYFNGKANPELVNSLLKAELSK
ncbi:MAG: Asp-tRNA(Asn)/Glu-tRNA(Gln) amidotransferase subunit GatB [Holosporales bacterium]|jgi:aspartyl-tRNA(Asn)/glutamyl-tRNA(Gln) amidotransferase subunit B|nr:Asp-tRNA(Asn)/Glu-tRNA(Gln) amidotransferase subunit GatB [Holosporales bacterium]